MKIGDRVEVLDCIYENEEFCKGNFGFITETIKPHFETLYMVRLDSWPDEDWTYIETELRVVT